jgi:hypothetical protein
VNGSLAENRKEPSFNSERFLSGHVFTGTSNAAGFDGPIKQSQVRGCISATTQFVN